MRVGSSWLTGPRTIVQSKPAAVATRKMWKRSATSLFAFSQYASRPSAKPRSFSPKCPGSTSGPTYLGMYPMAVVITVPWHTHESTAPVLNKGRTGTKITVMSNIIKIHTAREAQPNVPMGSSSHLQHSGGCLQPNAELYQRILAFRLLCMYPGMVICSLSAGDSQGVHKELFPKRNQGHRSFPCRRNRHWKGCVHKYVAMVQCIPAVYLGVGT